MEYPLGGYNKDYNSRLSRPRSINLLLEPNSDGTFFRVRRASGLRSKYSVGQGPCRGIFEIQGELFIVSRNKLFKISQDESITELGDVGGSTSKVYIDANGADDNQIIIISDGVGFIYDASADPSIQEIDSVNFSAGSGVASLNQIFWVPMPDSNTLQGSNTADGLTWESTRRVSAEQNPDILQIPVALGSALWLFGDKTVEYWQTDLTDSINPIRPVQGATIQRGVGAVDSVTKWQNSAFWLADDFTVWQITGSESKKISDLSLEYAIQGDGRTAGYVRPQAARGFFIDHPVHKLYVLSFPAAQVTWVYDVMTGLWHERQSKDIGRWRGQESALFKNNVIIGDYRTGDLWLLSESEFTENGETLKAQLVPPTIRDKEADTVIESVELLMEIGVGGISGVDSLGILKNEPIAPMIQVESSKDGGASWQQRNDLSIGRVGERNIKVISRVFGRVRKKQPFMLRFTVTDAVPVEMYELHIETSRS